MPKVTVRMDSSNNRKRRELHRKLDAVMDKACRELAKTTQFIIESAYKIVQRTKRDKKKK